jgi:hypothetical protein
MEGIMSYRSFLAVWIMAFSGLALALLPNVAAQEKVKHKPEDIAGSYKDPRYPDGMAEVKWDKDKEVFYFRDGSGADSTWKWYPEQKLYIADNGGDRAFFFHESGTIAFESKVFWTRKKN